MLVSPCPIILVHEPVVLIERCVIEPPPCDPCHDGSLCCDDWLVCQRIDRLERPPCDDNWGVCVDIVEVSSTAPCEACETEHGAVGRERKAYAAPPLAAADFRHDQAPPNLDDVTLFAYQRVTNLGTLFDLIA